MKNRVPLLIILIFPILICWMAWYIWYIPVTTIYLVRHAERLNDTDTTSISEIGIRRARVLARVLSSSNVNRIYVSEKSRTLQTAEPTSDQYKITPMQITASDITRYVDSIKAHRGDVILIVGHSDTVPKIIGKLGIADPPAIDRTAFDDLFVVVMFRYRSVLLRLRY